MNSRPLWFAFFVMALAVYGCQGPAASTSWEQNLLKSPDITGPLSKSLKITFESATWEELRTRLHPDFIFSEIGSRMCDTDAPRDLLWIEKGTDGKPVFRLDRAFVWKPTGKEARWILIDTVNGPEDNPINLLGEQIGSQSMAARVELIAKKPDGDHPENYAIVKATDPRGGTLYEIGWAPEMSMGAGHMEQLRLIYVWREVAGRWRFVGQGPTECMDKDQSDCSESTVTWGGLARRPTINFVNFSCAHDRGERELGRTSLVTCSDYRLEASITELPAKLKITSPVYIVAEKGDTLTKIVDRICIWWGDWGGGVNNPDEKTMRYNSELRRNWLKKLLKLNPDLAKSGYMLATGQRIIISEEPANDNMK